MSIKPILFNTDMVRAILDGRKTVTGRVVKPQPMGYFEVNDNPVFLYDFDPPAERRHSTYQPGDILYVRETWQKTYINDGTTRPTNFKYEYKASDEQRTVYRWNPSIHMPKEAARIWLKVTNVRVERLQDITTNQVLAEGTRAEEPFELNGEEKLYAFSQLWDSTIKKADIERYGWESNPWVWVIEFERCEKPQEDEK
jgi:hypothetical protein